MTEALLVIGYSVFIIRYWIFAYLGIHLLIKPATPRTAVR